MKNNSLLFFLFALSSMLPPFIGRAIDLSIPVMSTELGMGIISIGALSFIPLLTIAILLVPCGRLADIYGKRRLFIYGLILFSLTTILCGISITTSHILIARALQGIGSALMLATIPALLLVLFPPSQRGKVLGINVSGVYIGNAIGPSLGGIITHHFGWRFVFFATATLALGALSLALLLIKQEWKDAHDEEFDLQGSMLYGLAITLILYGIPKSASLWGIAMIIAGCGIGFWFYRYTTTKKHPLFDLALFHKNRQFTFGNVTALFNFTSTFCIPFLLSILLQYVYKLTPQQAGFIMITAPLTIALCSPLAGILADTTTPKSVASIGQFLSTFALFFMSFDLSPIPHLPILLPILIVFGIGLGFFASPSTHNALRSITPKNMGVAASLLSTMRVIGQTMSISLATFILSTILGQQTIALAPTPDILKSIKLTLFILGCISAVALYFNQKTTENQT